MEQTMEVSGQKVDDSTNERGNTDESLEVFCDPCKNDGETLPAAGYCVECEEYLCKDCYKFHCRPSVTRHHVLQEKENMPRKRPSKPAEKDLPAPCHLHVEQSVDYYCKSHEEPCCAVCKSTSHDKCDNVKSISDILTDSDMGQELNVLKGKIKELVCDVDNTHYQVQASLKAIDINHDVARSNMCELRQAVNDHLDEIENNLDKKLKTIRMEDLKKTISYKNKCDAMNFDINTMESYLEGKLKTNKKNQLFLAMKKAESKIKSNHDDLQKIRVNNKVQRYEFAAEKAVDQLKTTPHSFGDFTIKTSQLKTTQCVADLDVKSNTDTETCCITGLTLIADNILVAADNKNKSIKLINIKENTILAEAKLAAAPWDVTNIKDTQIAVTLPFDEKIQLFSVHASVGLEIVKELTVGKKGYGIEFMDTEGKFLLSSCDPGKVEIIDMEGRTIKTFGLNLDVPHYVSWIPSKKLISISDIRLDRNKQYQDGCIRYVTFDSDDPREISKVIYLDGSRFKPFGLASDVAGASYICDLRNRVYFNSYEEYKKETNMTCQSSGFCFSSGLFGQSPGHPNMLIDYREEGISPRSAIYCNKTFRLFIGMLGDKIRHYLVA